MILMEDMVYNKNAIGDKKRFLTKNWDFNAFGAFPPPPRNFDKQL